LKAEFVKSVNDPGQLPTDGLPEVAFLGRSNVGKSSLINALVGQRKLAFTSNTPGRTQSLNFYRIDDQFYFVDLPGYGYARAPRESVDEWARFIEHYLRERKHLGTAVVVLDARRGWMEKDLDLKMWLEANGWPYKVVASKMDKLNQAEQQRGLKAIRQYAEPLPFSATTGRGVREIWQAITKTHQS
jgi:GTP-binding protein